MSVQCSETYIQFCPIMSRWSGFQMRVHLARPQQRLPRRPDASPSSPDHSLQVHYQCPTRLPPTHDRDSELEFASGLWVVTLTAWISPSLSPGPQDRVPGRRRGRQDISQKA
jgi:hypothetical protein